MALVDGAVPLKVYVKRSPGTKVQQTRRVSLLRPSLAHVLSTVGGWVAGPFQLTYQDGDGDQVTMETEAEWGECLRLWAAHQTSGRDALHLTCIREKACAAKASKPEPFEVTVSSYGDRSDEDQTERAVAVEQVLEKLFGADPLLRIRVGEVPPHLLAMHADWMQVRDTGDDAREVDLDVAALAKRLTAWGHADFDADNFEGAADWFRIRSMLGPDRSSVYNHACARARMGDFAGAFESLSTAMSMGTDIEAVERDSDFEELRKIPGWRARLVPAAATSKREARLLALQRRQERMLRMEEDKLRRLQEREERQSKKLRKQRLRSPLAPKWPQCSDSDADIAVLEPTLPVEPAAPAAEAAEPSAPAAVAAEPSAPAAEAPTAGCDSASSDSFTVTVSDEHQYAQQIRTIAELGLDIDDRVLAALREHDGNLHATLAALLE
eukprot:TRINITY_DN3936_c0_g2_i2.p1 TRINITY_DN3936_c0_g2~~TRINITY_DN3936_c0_g2_i2.p1  ORF type:complete len:439 (+),score=142.62 TRINITY_DN3936_c0_g2_i2:58-1374(+)